MYWLALDQNGKACTGGASRPVSYNQVSETLQGVMDAHPGASSYITATRHKQLCQRQSTLTT